MKKKGFTLVELLAVIAILAILVIIALPNILKLYRNARKSMFYNEVNSIISTSKRGYLLGGASAQTWTNVDGAGENKLSINARDNLKYYISVDDNGNITKLQVTDGTYQYSKSGSVYFASIDDVEEVSDLGQDEILVIRGPIFKFITRQNANDITMEDELAIGEEHFYVVSSDSNTTILLTKYELNTTTLSQVSSGASTGKFSTSGYWNGKVGTGLQYPGKYCSGGGYTGCAFVYDSNSALYNTVNSYANKISNANDLEITARLMKSEEANSLSKDIRKDNNGDYYWLGTPSGSAYLLAVSKIGTISDCSMNANLECVIFQCYHSKHIRPVIIVKTSDIYNNL